MGYLLSVLGTLLLLTNIILFFTSHHNSDSYHKNLERKKRSSNDAEEFARKVFQWMDATVSRLEKIHQIVVQKNTEVDESFRKLDIRLQAFNKRIENLERINEVAILKLPVAGNIMPKTNSNHSVALVQQSIHNCQSDNSCQLEFRNVSQCGGVIKANSGIIQYKLNETYNYNEYCAWTILTDLSTLQFNLTKYGFYYFDDVITVLNINPVTESLQKLGTFKWKNKSPIQNLTINSGHAIVVFSADRHYTGKGFQLEFQASGERNPDVKYTASHYNDTVTNINTNESFGNDTRLLYQIITQSSSDNDAAFRVDVNRATFDKFYTNINCYYDTYKAYELIEGAHLHKLGELPSQVDKINCSNNIQILSRPWFSSSTGAYIVIMRKIGREIITQFTSNKEKRDMSISTACGGLVVGDSGYISYKENELYEKNENCTWHVTSKTSHSKIHFTIEKEGFDLCCDHLAIDMDKGRTRWLSTRPSASSMTVRDVMYKYSWTSVRFTSGGRTSGTGFRLKYKTYPLQTSDQSDSDE